MTNSFSTGERATGLALPRLRLSKRPSVMQQTLEIAFTISVCSIFSSKIGKSDSKKGSSPLLIIVGNSVTTEGGRDERPFQASSLINRVSLFVYCHKDNIQRRLYYK